MSFYRIMVPNMKKFILLLALIVVIDILSCSDYSTNIENNNNNTVKPIIYFDGNLNNLISDSISIKHIDIKKDILIIYYNYLGGCGTHQINLFSEFGFEETSPVQLRMRLVQHSFSETCQNVVNGKTYFDLKSAAALFKSSYGNQKGEIRLSIFGSEPSTYMPLPKYEF